MQHGRSRSHWGTAGREECSEQEEFMPSRTLPLSLDPAKGDSEQLGWREQNTTLPTALAGFWKILTGKVCSERYSPGQTMTEEALDDTVLLQLAGGCLQPPVPVPAVCTGSMTPSLTSSTFKKSLWPSCSLHFILSIKLAGDFAVIQPVLCCCDQRIQGPEATLLYQPLRSC